MVQLKAFFDKYKTYFYIVFFCFFILSIFFYIGKKETIIKGVKEQNVKLQMELILKDSLVKISDGKYKKMVDFYTSPKQLSEIVKTNSPTIFGLVTKNKERILSNTGIALTFKKDTTQSTAVKKDSIFSFTSYYPTKENSFIQLDGLLNENTKAVDEKWSFNNIKLNVVLTEQADGLWNTYLDAPEFVKVNSIKVNSIPKESYIPKAEKPKLFNFYGGLGIRSSWNTLNSPNGKDLAVKGAVTIGAKVMIETDISTDKKVGAGVLIRL